MWPIRSNFRKHARMRCHGICVQTKTHAELQTLIHSYTHTLACVMKPENSRKVETREKHLINFWMKRNAEFIYDRMGR